MGRSGKLETDGAGKREGDGAAVLPLGRSIQSIAKRGRKLTKTGVLREARKEKKRKKKFLAMKLGEMTRKERKQLKARGQGGVRALLGQGDRFNKVKKQDATVTEKSGKPM